MKKHKFMGDKSEKGKKQHCFDEETRPTAVRNKHLSLEDEARIAKEVGFATQPASGATRVASQKGDGKDECFLYELKRQSGGGGFNVNYGVLEKVRREAAMQGRIPVLIVTGTNAPETLSQEWAVIPLSLFKQMKEQWSE